MITNNRGACALVIVAGPGIVRFIFIFTFRLRTVIMWKGYLATEYILAVVVDFAVVRVGPVAVVAGFAVVGVGLAAVVVGLVAMVSRPMAVVVCFAVVAVVVGLAVVEAGLAEFMRLM
jgi:hypothetical protein